MTQRQIALVAGISGVTLVVLIAATVTVVARRGGEPEQAPVVANPTVATTTTSTVPMNGTSTEPVETASTTRPGVILAHSYLVQDLATKEVLAQRASTDRWPLASLTKVMTAWVALDRIPEDAPVTIVPVPGGNPSAPGIPVGSTFAMKDVLDVMLVSSSNEAAESLAAFLGREQFMAEMNAVAQQWGLTHTVFQDPSGLSAGNQSTAAEYLALVERVRAGRPDILARSRKGQTTVYAAGTGVPYTGFATHQLVSAPGFLGGKTGFTDEARGNLLSLFRVGDREVAFVVLGSEQRFADTRGLLATIKLKP